MAFKTVIEKVEEERKKKEAEEAERERQRKGNLYVPNIFSYSKMF